MLYGDAQVSKHLLECFDWNGMDEQTKSMCLASQHSKYTHLTQPLQSCAVKRLANFVLLLMFHPGSIDGGLLQLHIILPKFSPRNTYEGACSDSCCRTRFLSPQWITVMALRSFSKLITQIKLRLQGERKGWETREMHNNNNNTENMTLQQRALEILTIWGSSKIY